MKKAIFFVAVGAFVGFLGFGSIASADDVIPGAYSQQDQSVMGVGQTMMQMGANTRVLTNATNLRSQAGNSRRQLGVNSDYQFGSSQNEQSWKSWKTVEEVGVVVGFKVDEQYFQYNGFSNVDFPDKVVLLHSPVVSFI